MENKVELLNHVKKQLKGKGCKPTKQRLKIVEAIYDNNLHMNVEEIFSKVKDKNVGLSTIYRNLLVLETVDIVNRIDVTNKSYFELNEIGENRVHIHAKCSRCNKIIDIDEEDLLEDFVKAVNDLERKHKFKVNSTSLIFSSVCKGKCL